eukprot:1201470-Amphidinium_carterae.1
MGLSVLSVFKSCLQDLWQVQQEEEEEGEENLRYESYDTGFVGDSHATRKKREQKDDAIRSNLRTQERAPSQMI